MKLKGLLKNENETLDTFYRGKILVLQKKKGYRFSVDAPLLADFVRTDASEELIELGAGNGIVSLLVSIKPFKHITAVEIQHSLADLARRNVKLNSLEEKIAVVEDDFRSFEPGKKFDVVFSNPPYIKKKTGQLSPSFEISLAKHELKCTLSDLLGKTAQLLKREGRAYFIYPFKRRDDFMEEMKKAGLRLRRIREVFSRKNEPPRWFLAEGGFFGPKTELLPPFFLYNENGVYSEEAQKIFSGRGFDGQE
ncbi:MAG: tRNA1(Val) (adenine(37)-N6)-methyltransferase [Candidatus Aminicenantales bacterium]